MIPQHVAIIMDGNGRWAKMRGRPRFFGHIRGSAQVREIVREAKRQGIKALTLYAFSTENWKRPEDELTVIWKLLRKYIRREVKELDQNKVKLHVIGEIGRIPEGARAELLQAVEKLSVHEEFHLTFALSYGSRTEWVSAAKQMAEDCKLGKLQPQDISESVIDQYLWTSCLGRLSDVDLVIRTSGELRMSNFLLWQACYAEFDFPQTLWPDYTVEEFRKSLERYQTRERRLGGLTK